jgi:hypothetical protein
MILDLLGRYAWEIDHGTAEGWAGVFTPDGIFESPESGMRVQGRETLMAVARDLYCTLPTVHHVMSNHVIEVSGDTAKGRCELNEFMARPEAIYPNLQGWYEDDFVFVDQRWYIKHRRIYVAEPMSAMTGKVGEYFSPYFAAMARYMPPVPAAAS